MTRTRPVPAPRHAVRATIVTSDAARASRRSLCILVNGLLDTHRRVWIDGGENLHPQRLLQQYRGRKCIHVAFPPASAASHLLDRAERGGRGVAFVDQRHRQLRSPRELGRHATTLGRTWRVL